MSPGDTGSAVREALIKVEYDVPALAHALDLLELLTAQASREEGLSAVHCRGLHEVLRPLSEQASRVQTAWDNAWAASNGTKP